MAADVRGAASGHEGRGFRPVRHRQLVNSLWSHSRLHSPGGQLRPVCAIPDLHRGVCPLHIVQRRLHPRDSQPLTGGNRDLL